MIDRQTGAFRIRPHRSHRTYDATLSVVADIIVERVIKAELREKAKTKKARTR